MKRMTKKMINLNKLKLSKQLGGLANAGCGCVCVPEDVTCECEGVDDHKQFSGGWFTFTTMKRARVHKFR
jgi:hypothetical protein